MEFSSFLADPNVQAITESLRNKSWRQDQIDAYLKDWWASEASARTPQPIPGPGVIAQPVPIQHDPGILAKPMPIGGAMADQNDWYSSLDKLFGGLLPGGSEPNWTSPGTLLPAGIGGLMLLMLLLKGRGSIGKMLPLLMMGGATASSMLPLMMMGGKGMDMKTMALMGIIPPALGLLSGLMATRTYRRRKRTYNNGNGRDAYYRGMMAGMLRGGRN